MTDRNNKSALQSDYADANNVELATIHASSYHAVEEFMFHIAGNERLTFEVDDLYEQHQNFSYELWLELLSIALDFGSVSMEETYTEILCRHKLDDQNAFHLLDAGIKNCNEELCRRTYGYIVNNGVNIRDKNLRQHVYILKRFFLLLFQFTITS